MTPKSKTVEEKKSLGSLELWQVFTFLRGTVLYRTVTYTFSKANPKQGSRSCMNLRSKKVSNLPCKLIVKLKKLS